MRTDRWLRSRSPQLAIPVLAVLAVGAINASSDGLWFQGDAPRHAVNGLFWWDLLTALPRDPLGYAVRYYARYPVIAPATYPPLFYVLEGSAFALLGPSPFVAKALVMVFALVAVRYLLMWLRNRVDPAAGWIAAFLVFVPGFMVWSNAVMLNIPATAFALATLHHFRRWMDSTSRTDLLLTGLFLVATVLTYYPAVCVVAVLAGWAALRFRAIRLERTLWLVVAFAVAALIPLAVVLSLTPVHTSRHLPTLAFLGAPATWTYYWRTLPGLVGIPTLILGAAGCVAGLVSARWRAETSVVALWIVLPIVALSLVPARDPRYILWAAPAFLVLIAIGLASISPAMPPVSATAQLVVLIAALGIGGWLAVRARVPRITGFRDVAIYLKDRAPTDAVLYDGDYDGLFGFYMRALDPRFERRLVLADKFLYFYGPTTTFRWTMQSTVTSTADVVAAIQQRSGCRWVLVETGPRVRRSAGARLLRDALKRPEFESVQTFTIHGAGDRRIELYRVRSEVAPVSTVNLRFPSLTDQTFSNVVPVSR